MIRVTDNDFKKMIKMLEKESQGGPITVRTDGSTLQISCLDRSGKDMVIELSDMNYPMMPRITKTETF